MDQSEAASRLKAPAESVIDDTMDSVDELSDQVEAMPSEPLFDAIKGDLLDGAEHAPRSTRRWNGSRLRDLLDLDIYVLGLVTSGELDPDRAFARREELKHLATGAQQHPPWHEVP